MLFNILFVSNMSNDEFGIDFGYVEVKNSSKIDSLIETINEWNPHSCRWWDAWEELGIKPYDAYSAFATYEDYADDMHKLSVVARVCKPIAVIE